MAAAQHRRPDPAPGIQGTPHVKKQLLVPGDDLKRQTTLAADLLVRLPGQQSGLQLPTPRVVLLGDLMGNAEYRPAMPDVGQPLPGGGGQSLQILDEARNAWIVGIGPLDTFTGNHACGITGTPIGRNEWVPFPSVKRTVADSNANDRLSFHHGLPGFVPS
jgi:hypothetical protein